jgi:hypothetical protein
MSEQKKKNLIKLIAVIILVAGLIYFATPIGRATENGVTSEIRILKYNTETGLYDREVVLGQKPRYALYTVNDVSLNEQDIVLTRAWLNLRAVDFTGEIENLHYKVTSSIDGTVLCEWGTEVTGDTPIVPANAEWLTRELPRGNWVSIPLWFYDSPNLLEIPSSEQPPDFPYSSVYPNPSCQYRTNSGDNFLTEGHVFGLYEWYNQPSGTYNVELAFEVLSFQLKGDPKTYTQTDFPDIPLKGVITYNIVKSGTTLEVEFVADATYDAGSPSPD